MTTSELISYINKQIKNNISKDLIISKLIGAGWHREDIDEGFSIVEKSEKTLTVSIPPVKEEIVDLDGVGSIESIQKPVSIQSGGDKYREPITVDNILGVEKPVSIPTTSIPSEVKPTNTENLNKIKEPEKVEIPIIKETPKVEVPIVKEEKKEELEIEVAKVELPVGEVAVEAPKVESVKVEIPKIEPIAEPVKVEIPKVWTPFQAPIKEKPKTEEVKIEKVEPVKVEVKEPKSVVKKEELIPTLKPKQEQNPFGYVSVNNPTPPASSPNNQNEAPKISSGKDLPRMAMMSSYQKDMISMSNANNIIIKKNYSKIIKWVIIALIAVSLVGAGVFAFANGYVKMPNLNFLNLSFIKKDPKILLLENSKVLSSLSSYKTETKIEISSPSLATISYGLVSGEAVSGNEKDSMSVKVLGKINKNEGGLLSDNSITVKSSILTNDINSNVKNVGEDMFISISDFSQIFKDDITIASAIKLNQQQFDLIPALFPLKVEEKLNKINIHKVLSSGVSSYVNEDILTSYNELINNVEVIQKGEENIKGVDTYHYSVNADRQLAKDLLVKLSDNFLKNLSYEDQDNISGILGAVRIDSFEVWVGKGDSNIYQYSIAVNVPISKIVGFEDKSIGDSKVDISWKTTYYDFNIPNEILIPENSMPITDFVDSVNGLRIKSNVLDFKEAIGSLYNIEKSYGVKPNTNGGCMEPASGSLFSPTGHPKKADLAVSSISAQLKDVLKVTENNSSCYSTTKDWSFSLLLSDTPSSVEGIKNRTFFCVDSKGNEQILTAFPTSVSCTPSPTSR